MPEVSASSSISRRAWLSAGAPILVLVLVVTALASLLVANFAHTQDREFETQSAGLMQSAFEERVRAVNHQAWDYGRWDDAYRAVTAQWDQQWVDENFRSAVADGLMIIRADGTTGVRHLWLSEPYAERTDNIGPALLAAVQTTMRQGAPIAGEVPVHAGRMTIDGRLAAYAIAPVQMMDGSPAVRDYLVIVEIFEPNEISGMAAARNLEDAAFTPGARPAGWNHVALPIASAGETIGNLTWRNEHPGSAAFVGHLWPILVTLIFVGAMTLLVARRLVAAQVKAATQAEFAIESSRVRAEFISTMSHELRTPLNAIIGYSEMIQEQAEDIGTPAVAEIESDAGHVLTAAKHLRQLVDDILDHSKFEAGRIRLVLERLPIDALLADTAELMAPVAQARSNKLIFRNTVSGYDVSGDDRRVRQCLINLVGNAAKFTKNGAITVTARLDKNGSCVAFDVADTGIGIEPEVLPQLFQPFAQARAGMTSTYGGAGLSLSISQKLARAMGGNITVTSEAGQGSTFTLLLPATPTGGADRAAA